MKYCKHFFIKKILIINMNFIYIHIRMCIIELT